MFRGHIVLISNPLTYQIKIDIQDKDLEKFETAYTGKFKYISEKENEIKEDIFYICRIVDLELVQGKQKEIYSIVRSFFMKTGNYVNIQFCDIDLYKRLLVDIFDKDGKSLYDTLLNYRDSLGEEVVKVYTKFNEDENKENNPPNIDDMVYKINDE